MSLITQSSPLPLSLPVLSTWHFASSMNGPRNTTSDIEHLGKVLPSAPKKKGVLQDVEVLF